MKGSQEQLVEAITRVVDKYEPTPEELGAAVARVIYGHAAVVGMGAGMDIKARAKETRPVSSGLTRSHGSNGR